MLVEVKHTTFGTICQNPLIEHSISISLVKRKKNIYKDLVVRMSLLIADHKNEKKRQCKN